jgi:ribosomal protein L37AE/L43A
MFRMRVVLQEDKDKDWICRHCNYSGLRGTEKPRRDLQREVGQFESKFEDDGKIVTCT